MKQLAFPHCNLIQLKHFFSQLLFCNFSFIIKLNSFNSFLLINIICKKLKKYFLVETQELPKFSESCNIDLHKVMKVQACSKLGKWLNCPSLLKVRKMTEFFCPKLVKVNISLVDSYIDAKN